MMPRVLNCLASFCRDISVQLSEVCWRTAASTCVFCSRLRFAKIDFFPITLTCRRAPVGVVLTVVTILVIHLVIHIPWTIPLSSVSQSVNAFSQFNFTQTTTLNTIMQTLDLS